MKPTPTLRLRAGGRSPRHSRGVVMLFVLITMVILLIGAAALLRSFNTSLTSAGNIAFKRDLMNQAERAVPLVMTAVQSGALSSEAGRANNLPAQNYSATSLSANNAGIPQALLSDAAFAAVGSTSNDISVSGQGVRIRYVVDRLCDPSTPAGTTDSVAASTYCALANGGAPTGGSSSNLVTAVDATSGGAGALVLQVVYRVSIRVDGPRGTQAFFQTTFTL